MMSHYYISVEGALGSSPCIQQSLAKYTLLVHGLETRNPPSSLEAMGPLMDCGNRLLLLALSVVS